MSEQINCDSIGDYSNKELEEGIDFYYSEDGYKVFTEAYHTKRGYCCKNDCRHCPYRVKKRERNNNSKEVS